MQIEKSEEFKNVLHIYAKETTFGDKKYDYCRLKFMVQGHIEQKITCFHFKARDRDDDRPAIGAVSRGKSEKKKQRKCQTLLLKKRLHSFDHTRALFIWTSMRIQMTRTRKSKGKGWLRSPSPTASPHRNSKGDGKGNDDGGAKGTQSLNGKSLSVRANRLLCRIFKRENCQKGNPCNYWHVPERAKFKSPAGCKHSDMCWWKKSATCCHSHYGEWGTPDANTENSVGWQDSIPSETSLSREQVFSKNGKIRTYTWSHPDSVPKSTKSKRSNFWRKIHRMDFEHGRDSKKSSLDCTQERLQSSRFISREPNSVLQTRSRAQCFFTLPQQRRKRVGIHCDSEASLHMMSWSDLTPEENETTRKLKDPLVIMTVNGTTHTSEEATVHVYGLDMCVQVQLLKESPAVLSLGKLNEKKRLHVWMASRSEKSIVKPTTTSSWWSQACHQPNTRPKLRASGSKHKLWATTSDVCKKRNTSMASTIHGWTDKVTFKFDRRICRDVEYHRQDFFLTRIIWRSLLRTEQGENTIYSLFVRKTRISKYADARKLRERHAEEILTIGRTEKLPKDLVIW